MNLREQIENYIPFDETEEKLKKYLLDWIDTFNDVLTRENEFGHFVCSAFVVNKDRTKCLLYTITYMMLGFFQEDMLMAKNIYYPWRFVK